MSIPSAAPGGTTQIGTPSYERTYSVATEPSGSYFIAGESAGDIDDCGCLNPADGYVAKYSADGAVKWLVEFDADGYTHLRGIALGPSGHVVVGGHTAGDLVGTGHLGGLDVFLAKLDKKGNMKWIRQMGTPAVEELWSVATDADGNSYLAGFTYGGMDGNVNAGATDAYVMMVDALGNRRWTRQIGTPAGDQAFGIAVDAAGNVFAAGNTEGVLDGSSSAGGGDVFVAKLDPGGGVLWIRQFGTGGYDTAYALCTDSAGNLYIVGDTEGDLGGYPNAGGPDAYVAKLDPDGNEVWVRTFATPETDRARGVGIDRAGFVYVAGWTNGSLAGPNAGGLDGFVAKLDAGGDVKWISQFGSDCDEYVSGTAVSGKGDVFISGGTYGDLAGNGNAGDSDSFVVKYDSNGNRY